MTGIVDFRIALTDKNGNSIDGANPLPTSGADKYDVVLLQAHTSSVAQELIVLV